MTPDSFTALEDKFLQQGVGMKASDASALFAEDEVRLPYYEAGDQHIVYRGDIREGQFVGGQHHWVVVTGDIKDNASISLRQGLISARAIGDNVQDLQLTGPIIVSSEAAEVKPNPDAPPKLLSWCLNIPSVQRKMAALVAVPEAQRGRLVHYLTDMQYRSSSGLPDFYRKLWLLAADEKDIPPKEYADRCAHGHLAEWR